LAGIQLPEINFIEDGPGKSVGINEHIGRRPIAAFGNSDGDFQMLQRATVYQRCLAGVRLRWASSFGGVDAPSLARANRRI
jgi:hypothetical protein